MVYSMKFLTTSALLFPLWLGIGAFIYFFYGYRKNRYKENEIHKEKVEQRRLELQKQLSGSYLRGSKACRIYKIVKLEIEND